MDKNESFWHIRAAKYDKLFWTKDESYIDAIIKAADLKRTDLVLDVGTGTGAIARAIKPHVKHVIGMDFSRSMLEKGKWEGISLIKWNIADSLFHNHVFNKLVARMVFHHIMDNLDRAFLRCFDLLKKRGALLVAEGIPPTDDQSVIDWYSHMFSFKEERRTFTVKELEFYFRKNGFKRVKTHIHITKNFSINNWLDNSGLKASLRDKIMDLHLKMDDQLKQAYKMKVVKGEILVDTKNAIVIGEK